MIDAVRKYVTPPLSVALCLLVVKEANYAHLKPLSQMALFALAGLVMCFLFYPLSKKHKDAIWAQCVDLALAVLSVGVCGYMVVQAEPYFSQWWIGGKAVFNRAGAESSLDFIVGAVGILLFLEATRRAIGWSLLILSVVFIFYAMAGPWLPVFSHRGMDWQDVAAKAFLTSTGVFGIPMGVMFRYVFLFVIFGAFLEVTGGTRFVIDFSNYLFGRTIGGPAKVTVLASGMMGSLSGSAVANAMTTGTFTIPVMRRGGFSPVVAGGITAAAASGGALMPPVMGAGAYMMLELVKPEPTFLQIMRAAIIPAILYYFSILLIVHLFAHRLHALGKADAGSAQPATNTDGENADANHADAEASGDPSEPKQTLGALLTRFDGAVFTVALGTLIALLIVPFSPAVAVTWTLAAVLGLGMIHPKQRLSFKIVLEALIKSAKLSVSLIVASGCVGIVIAMVLSTGVTDQVNSLVADVVARSLFLALVGIMICSIILGMGVPSAVCYLLMATLMGGMLSELGVIPLAAHMFIFYFGMMSMVTPPVALAAYASASIAGADIMKTGLSAFKFSLVGFTLPFMFVYRPALLLMDQTGEQAAAMPVVMALVPAIIGITALAAAIAGYLFHHLSSFSRGVMLASAACALAPLNLFGWVVPASDVAGLILFGVVAVINFRSVTPNTPPSADPPPEGAPAPSPPA